MFCIGSILVQDVSHFEPAVCHGWGGWTIPSNNTEMNFRFPPIGKTSTLTARCSAKCLEKVLKYSVDVDESHGKKGKHKEFILRKKTPFRNPTVSLIPKQYVRPKISLTSKKKSGKKPLENRQGPISNPRGDASEREVHHSWASSIRSVELQGPQPVCHFDPFNKTFLEETPTASWWWLDV